MKAGKKIRLFDRVIKNAIHWFKVEISAFHDKKDIGSGSISSRIFSPWTFP
jgi:hypothetical protein